MACQSVAAVMDEQALLGLNPNADARYRQRVRAHAAANHCLLNIHEPVCVCVCALPGHGVF